MDRPAHSGYGGFAPDPGTVPIRRHQPHVPVCGKDDPPPGPQPIALPPPSATTRSGGGWFLLIAPSFPPTARGGPPYRGGEGLRGGWTAPGNRGHHSPRCVAVHRPREVVALAGLAVERPQAGRLRTVL